MLPAPPPPSFHDEGVLLKLSSWRPPEAFADAQHAIGARSRQQLAESSPMAVAARRRCSRWQRARILGAEHVQDARSQAKVQALSNTANEGAEEGLKGTGRQCCASVHRERLSAMATWRAEVAQLTWHINSSTRKILPDARQESALAATGIPAIHEWSNGVKLRVGGGLRQVVGQPPDRVRGKRTTQGASARGTRAPSSACWMAFFHVKKGGTLCAV